MKDIRAGKVDLENITPEIVKDLARWRDPSHRNYSCLHHIAEYGKSLDRKAMQDILLRFECLESTDLNIFVAAKEKWYERTCLHLAAIYNCHLLLEKLLEEEEEKVINVSVSDDFVL